MQIPSRTALNLDLEASVEESVQQEPTDSEFQLILDEEDDAGGDHTIMVPRSPKSGEQSTEDAIASDLDLAKAYVELGNTDEAKTILDKVIAIGNDLQRQQAKELLGQI
jgi:pilus assembly protein FimV